MAETYNTCFCCEEEIMEGDHAIQTEDVNCTHKSKYPGDISEYETWDYNPPRGIYCTECWDEILSSIRKLSDKRKSHLV